MLFLPACLTLATLLGLYFLLNARAIRRDALRKERHVFLDLETYSARANAAVLAIGAVCVNLLGEEIDRVKILVYVSDAVKNGHSDPRTVQWWAEQSPEAKALTFGVGDRHTLFEALAQYSDWHSALGPVEGVWGNGSSFDCTILRSAYDTISGEFPQGCPWDFWQERDVRTVVALGWLAKLPNFKKETPFIGTAHNCVDDAAHQAKYTTRLIRRLL
jgi:exodeoxyribonuclease VIII